LSKEKPFTKKELRNQNSGVRILNALFEHELRVETPIERVCTECW